MDMQEQLREAILDELRRQGEAGQLEVNPSEDRSSVALNGQVDIDSLVMVIAGSVAGGP